MSIPFMFLFSYLVFGVIATMGIWDRQAMEIEMSIEMEEEEHQDILRLFMVLMFIVTWPLVLIEIAKR